jgi:DNA-binding transcriptional MerR regulator
MDRRVEQLAAESGVSVDTIRYYQSKGLLAPPRRQGRFAWYQDDHLETLTRVRSLQNRGFTLATIVRLVNGELDAADEALVAELTGPSHSAPTADARKPGSPPGAAPEHLGRARPGTTAVEGPAGATDGVDIGSTAVAPPEGARFTLTELAERTGVPLALLKAVEAEGLLVPQRFGTEERYTDEDVEAARAGLLLLEWGVPLSALLELSRAHHAATEEVARQAVALFSIHVRGSLRLQAASSNQGHDGEDEGAQLVTAFTELLPAVNTLVGHHFTRTLLKAAFDHIEQEGTDLERKAVWAEADRAVASRAGTDARQGAS